jgi:hypothetical protein
LLKERRFLPFAGGERIGVDQCQLADARYRFLGDKAKQYAESLRRELERRRLQFAPIDWPR